MTQGKSFAEIAEQFVEDVQNAFEDDGKVRHAEVLASFVAYCRENPKQRFWQAVRNWSEYHTIFGFKGDVYALEAHLPDEILVDLHDTFYLEGTHK
jgi:hypothetical protein